MTAPRTPTISRPLPPELLERDLRCPFDPPAELRRLHAEAPVARTRLANGNEVWVVTGYDEARAVLADTRFSSDSFRRADATRPEPPLGPDEPRGDGMFIFMDPPEHTRLRRLLIGQFTVRRMRALEERVREIATDLITAMRDGGDRADLVPSFSLPLPSLVICELLGVDYADRAEFQDRTAVALNLNASDTERAEASAAIYRFMQGLVAQKREHPADDLLSGLVHDTEAALTDRELVDIAVTLLGAGHETTANMLALGTYALLEHPDQLAALRDDPELGDSAVEELLRYLSIIHTGPKRVATEDVELGGVTVAAGDTVLVSVPETNRDAGHWPEPERLDLSRGRTPHLAFGHGVHQCLGQQLARVELKIGLTELLARLPGLRLDVPAAEVPLRTDMIVFGVHALPVAWD
ncbi:cytochrome P450 [Pseudonocardia endophytica]|uniref:Cytochrome P450 n=1 Tax=Pseudonocardia endophytica TaxID=401976 RepID=A0A4R1HWT7_PSEEN|nr:cytochrome P450 [Pseudonocardia endophytica]TCK25953.1 cytochrome P450 [Pseudonocardia endophytica]